MNKVITINLNGSAFQLEEAGFDALRTYLDDCAAKLTGNPDRDEIIADIERAIADKFRPLLGAFKTVVLTKEVGAVIAEMGPVDDGSAAAGTAAADSQPGDAGSARAGPAGAATTEPDAARPAKRLFRLREGRMLYGVCNGLGAYFNIDTTLIRLAVVLLAFFAGPWVLVVYFAMAMVVPAAKTPAEKAAAQGMPFNAHEFVRRSMAGFYEGTKGFPDRGSRRAWQRKFKRDIKDWSRSFRWEMRSGPWSWWHCWEQPVPPAPAVSPFGGVVWPLLTLLRAALAFLSLAAVVSLLANDGIFGLPWPGGLPVWAGVILVLVAYELVALPLKAARNYFYHQGNGGIARPFFHLWDALVWFAFVVIVVALADHPEVNAAVKNLRQDWHQMVNSDGFHFDWRTGDDGKPQPEK